MRVRG
jgi:hypothetical protein